MIARFMPYLKSVGLLFLIYFVTARLGLLLDAVSGVAAAVWPPTGISLAALCLYGYRLWPGIALGAFLVNATAAGTPPLAAAGIAAGNTLEALLGAYLLLRVAGFRNSLDRLRPVIGLVLLAAGGSTLVSATIGVTCGWLGGTVAPERFGETWWTWWLGDIASNLVLAPLLFSWLGAAPRGFPPRRLGEAGLLLAGLITVGLLIFGGAFAGRTGSLPYLLYPFLIWAALRFDHHGATTATFAASVIAIGFTARGDGPFARETLSESLFLLQAFMSVTAATILVLAADRAERRRAQEALRESEEQRRLALQAGRMGTWDWNILMEQVSWSPGLELIHGLPPGSFDGTFEAYQRDIHPEDRERVMESIARAVKHGTAHEVEYRIVRPDSSVRWLEARGEVFRDEAGNPVRMRGVCQDVTKRKCAEERLREADRHKDEFLAMLAHELRNPLSAVSNAAQLLMQVAPDEPRLRRALETINRQVGHQKRLIDDLLDVSRLTRGRISLQCEPLDLIGLIRQSTEDHTSAVEAAGLSLRLELPAEPLWVMADGVRFSQVMGNLLSNAIKFTDPGGQITVGVRHQASGVGGLNPDAPRPTPHARFAVVTVRDTGIGIDPEVQRHIFESFVQADRSLERSRGGLGLGLALVKGLVELHGGTIQVSSGGLGCGAEFSFTLPLAADERREARDESPNHIPSRLSPLASRLRVLLVEDNQDAAETLRELLQLSGHEVVMAATGPAALETARRVRPEVVLCDIGLPGMDGYAVARALKQDPATSDARLISLSGYGQGEDRRQALEAGFEEHLTKPVGFADLERLLKTSSEPQSL